MCECTAVCVCVSLSLALSLPVMTPIPYPCVPLSPAPRIALIVTFLGIAIKQQTLYAIPSPFRFPHPCVQSNLQPLCTGFSDFALISVVSISVWIVCGWLRFLICLKIYWIREGKQNGRVKGFGAFFLEFRSLFDLCQCVFLSSTIYYCVQLLALNIQWLSFYSIFDWFSILWSI